ncbi:hypothetical protein TNIN_430271 [Trichonephila inaurata madagascariensis]|uniref:Uncharacterized protein n=1 Tax=Trichonephila inaurata madagascariensis TaxID=2747483 RepID=A0A8X6MLV7_9ARAC|nr:hypothetical protein TNIN_430271 [Trichonephila inaurata madagascariensis]
MLVLRHSKPPLIREKDLPPSTPPRVRSPISKTSPQAVHLGDLLRIWVRTGTKITPSPSVFQGPAEAHRTRQQRPCSFDGSVPFSSRRDSRDTPSYEEKSTFPRPPSAERLDLKGGQSPAGEKFNFPLASP